MLPVHCRRSRSCCTLALPTLLIQLLLSLVAGAQSQSPALDFRMAHFQTTHKFGYELTIKFIEERFQDVLNQTRKFYGETRLDKVFQLRIAPRVDEPFVTVVRDMIDATVSGYLYHKTGHECWIDHNGRPNPSPKGGNDWLRRENWTERVSKVPVVQDAETISFPQYNLCQALNATNETIGMGIYLEFARNSFYRSAAALRSRTEDPTLFVCFEEMAERPDETERRIRSFFEEAQQRQRNVTAPTNDGHRRRLFSYNGGHSTDHNPVLRARLRAIAREADCTYFGCETKAWNDSLNCTSEEERMSVQEEEEEEAGK